MSLKIWVDDIRRPPDDTWEWYKTSWSVISDLILMHPSNKSCIRLDGPVEVMSLDHDLGGDDTTRPIILWCCENNFWPVEVRVHSANPVGVEWLEGMIERYKS